MLGQRLGGLVVFWYQAEYFSLRGHITKFYYEDTLKNQKRCTSANKHKNLYLILAKTENCFTNFVFSLLEHNQRLRTLGQNIFVITK